jgi:hypothetical protein
MIIKQASDEAFFLRRIKRHQVYQILKYRLINREFVLLGHSENIQAENIGSIYDFAVPFDGTKTTTQLGDDGELIVESGHRGGEHFKTWFYSQTKTFRSSNKKLALDGYPR